MEVVMFGKGKLRVKCSSCNEFIGEIPYLPGKKYLGCGHCHKRTLVEINSDGEVHTKVYVHAVDWKKRNELLVKKVTRK